VKKVNGRKRHLLVDTLGLILAVLVHGAEVSEREGAGRLLQRVWAARQAGRGWFGRLRHLWVDAGYHAKDWLAWVEALLGTDGGGGAQAPALGLVPRRGHAPADAGLHGPETPLGRRAHLRLVGWLPPAE
jgi:Transposase DDE domain